ncbi:HK97-gp10 family putative phage morphogenesis protein [Aliarcobacter lanthieri]|uniref:HK97-gp10 family putative phage morphogenesis protein n=1 Tax=Aliarcobacter lanthieri TaxID=1355374 RepID=UPI003AAA4C9C
MGITANIKSDDLMKVLKKLPKNIQKNIMVGATRAGANVVRDKAKELVPKDTRNLEKSIGTIRRNSKNRAVVHFSVTNRKGRKQSHDGWYGHFAEFGTVKQAPEPFMRPALEQSQYTSLEASKEYIAKRIPAEVAKSKKG